MSRKLECNLCSKKEEAEIKKDSTTKIPQEWSIVLGTICCDKCTAKIAEYIEELEQNSF